MRNGLVYAKQLVEMPDYSNDATRLVEANLPPFRFDDREDDKFADQDLILRGPYELDNGAIYKGQWTK